MGLSWALSVCYVKFPEPTAQLLQSDKLTTECKRKAIQKIMESRRSTPEMRQRALLIRQTLKRITHEKIVFLLLMLSLTTGVVAQQLKKLCSMCLLTA